MGDVTIPLPGGGSGSQTLRVPPIALPDPAGLAEDQVYGRRCVWCAASLNNNEAVDLGARQVNAHGSGAHWFPRGCRPCAYTHLSEASQQHRKTCKVCSTSLPWCRTGQTLFGAAMRASRPVPR
ncbi:hypothetical protein ABZ791_19340 [Streptomyces huasconensis]|uniref:Uncharacterized protein n=1 Tax=Streptomyces huasconensis TaxID=1854574 RepID=A0ABV3M5J6_9ACTN